MPVFDHLPGGLNSASARAGCEGAGAHRIAEQSDQGSRLEPAAGFHERSWLSISNESQDATSEPLGFYPPAVKVPIGDRE